MTFWYFMLVYAGPFVALAALYLAWAFTAFVWQDKFPNYYKWSDRVNGWLPKIGAFVVIAGGILYIFGVFESRQ